LILGILADGAMYCGDKHVGMALYECSRRLVSQYMDSVGPQAATIPLWVINTLLLNAVFGLPGGESQECDITVNSFEILLKLAARVEPPPPLLDSGLATVDDEWKDFIERESRKRSLLCILIMARLWSAVYGSVPGIFGSFLNNVKVPVPEILWRAPTAVAWKDTSRRIDCVKLPRLEAVLHSLFSQKVTLSNGLSSLCQIVGLLIYMDEVRSASAMTSAELNNYFSEAIDNWTRSHSRQQHEHPASISFPAAAYARLLLQVDIPGAMEMFIKGDFLAMRSILRGGNLIEASRIGMSGLIPWAVAHKNQISMVSVPCAIVVSEAALIADNGLKSAKILHKALGLPDNEDISTPAAMWKCLRRIIETGPVTAVLLSCMKGYADIL